MMARLSSSLMLLSFLGAGLVAASPAYTLEDQETQERNANCNNGCLFKAWSEGYCVTDPACVCNDKERREKFFCCIAENCDPSVLPDQLERSGADCVAWNLPFTLDPEAVCGIKIRPVTSSSTLSLVSSTTGSASSGPASPTASSIGAGSGTPGSSSSGSQTNSGGASQTSSGSQTNSGGGSQTSSLAGSGASARSVVLSGVAGLVAASGLFLLW